MQKIKIVRQQGGSRVVAMSDIIPKDWQIVQMFVTEQKNGIITVNIEKVK